MSFVIPKVVNCTLGPHLSPWVFSSENVDKLHIVDILVQCCAYALVLGMWVHSWWSERKRKREDESAKEDPDEYFGDGKKQESVKEQLRRYGEEVLLFVNYILTVDFVRTYRFQFVPSMLFCYLVSSMISAVILTDTSSELTIELTTEAYWTLSFSYVFRFFPLFCMTQFASSLTCVFMAIVLLVDQLAIQIIVALQNYLQIICSSQQGPSVTESANFLFVVLFRLFPLSFAFAVVLRRMFVVNGCAASTERGVLELPYAQHVKRLLTRELDGGVLRHKMERDEFWAYVPTRLLMGLCGNALCTILLCVPGIVAVYQLVPPLLEQMKPTIPVQPLLAVAVFCFLLTTVFSLLMLWMMLLKYRTNALALRKGKLECPISYDNFSAVKSMNYIGAQIASGIFGWLLMAFTLFAVGFFVYVSITNKEFLDNIWQYVTSKFLVFFKFFLLRVVVIIIVFPILFTSDRLFTIRKNLHNLFCLCDFLWITFSFFSYWAGLFFRIVKVMVTALVSQTRIDLLPLSYPGFDVAYTSYMSLLLMDYRFNSPVVRCLLVVWPHAPCTEEAKLSPVFLRVRNRWQLAYTLLNNAGLRYSRSHALLCKDKFLAMSDSSSPSRFDVMLARLVSLRDLDPLGINAIWRPTPFSPSTSSEASVSRSSVLCDPLLSGDVFPQGAQQQIQ